MKAMLFIVFDADGGDFTMSYFITTQVKIPNNDEKNIKVGVHVRV